MTCRYFDTTDDDNAGSREADFYRRHAFDAERIDGEIHRLHYHWVSDGNLTGTRTRNYQYVGARVRII